MFALIPGSKLMYIDTLSILNLIKQNIVYLYVYRRNYLDCAALDMIVCVW